MSLGNRHWHTHTHTPTPTHARTHARTHISWPNTKPWPLHLRNHCCSSNSGSSDKSSVSGPRPEPGRRQTIWETQWSTQHTRSVKLQNAFTAALVFQIGQHHHLLPRNDPFWTPSFWTLGIWLSTPKKYLKYSKTQKRIQKIRLEAEYLDRISP